MVLFVLQLLKGKKIVIHVYQVFSFPNNSAFPFPIINGSIVRNH